MRYKICCIRTPENAKQTSTSNTSIFSNVFQTFLYPVDHYFVHHVRTYAAGYGPDAIRYAHKDTGVSRRDIQMVDVEPRDRESAEGHADGEGSHSLSYRVGVGHYKKEGGLHSET